MYTPKLITEPQITPVSLDEVKAHVKATAFADDDALLKSLIAAATAHLDGWDGILCRCLCQQTWQQDYDLFCVDSDSEAFGRFMRLPLYPVISITGVKYDDPDGSEKTVDSSQYELLSDEIGAKVRFINDYAFPAVSNEYPSVRIAYVAGYADADGASTVPDALKAAIKMLVGHWYNNREAVIADARAAAIELPLAVKALIAPYRRVRL